MARNLRCLSLSLFLVLAACSGGDDPPRCSTAGGEDLAAGSWPTFRADRANTGRSTADLGTNDGTCRWQFPPDGSERCGSSPPPEAEPAKGSFSASPGLNGDGSRLFVGSSDGDLYALDPSTGQELPTEEFDFPTTQAPIDSSPAISTGGLIHVTTRGALLLVVNPDGSTLRSAGLGGESTTSPTLATDGTAFVGSRASASFGAMLAVCANAIPRWSLVVEAIEAGAALGPDGRLSDGRIADCTVRDQQAPHGRVYFASASSSHPFVRAIDRCNGNTFWTFSASALMVAPPVLEVIEGEVETIFVADVSGRLFALNADGSRRDVDGTAFVFRAGDGIVAAPALDYPAESGEVATVYVASLDGNLYAVDTRTAAARAIFQTGGPIQSSPAVARDGERTTLVFGSDDGFVYRVIDQGDHFTEAWRFEIQDGTGSGVSIGRASPAIGADGVVFLGAPDGRVYALGAPQS
jgi:outer membrane protein assembly factor BamB